MLGSLATLALAAPSARAQLPLAASQVGPTQPYQASLPLSPNLEINLATGNLHLSVLTSRFDRTGRAPFHELYLFHNSLGAPEIGDTSGGLGLGNGWSSALGGKLQFPAPNSAHLAFPGGTSRSLVKLSPTLWRSEIGRELEVTTAGSGWIATDANQWTWHYDATGLLVQVSDASCNAYTIARTGGVATSVTDPSGRQVTFQSTAGRVTSVSDPSATSWAFAYDAQGRLDTVTDPHFGSIAFDFDARDRIVTFTDWTGASWQFTYYDVAGKQDCVKSVQDPNGHVRDFAYDDATVWETEVTELSGGVWTTQHALALPRALISGESPLGDLWQYEHDARCHIDLITSPLGHEWTFEHDDAGNLLSRTDPVGHTRTWSYDALNNPLSTTQDGVTLSWEYNDAQNPTSITHCIEPTAQGPAPTTVYDWYGPLDGTPAGAWNGCLASVTDPSGAMARFEFDSEGTRAAEEEGPLSAQGRVERRWDDPAGLPFVDHGIMPPSAACPAVPPLPTQVAGRLGALGDGSITAFGLADAQTWYFDVPLGNGETSTRTFDATQDEVGRALGLVVTTDEPYEFSAPPEPSPATLSFSGTHDDVGTGQPSVLSVPGGLTVTLLHRVDGALSSVSAMQGSVARFDNALSYDDDGRLTLVTRQDGSSTGCSYTASGAVDTITHKQGTVSKLALDYDYDARGLPVSRTETAGSTTLVTAWSYDLQGRLTREKRTVNGVVERDESLTYDLAGNRRTRVLHFNGQPSVSDTYFYDFDAPSVHGTHNNRLVSVERRGPNRVLISTLFLRYENPFGHVSHMVRVPAGSNAIQATRLEYTENGSPWLAWDESWTATAGGPVGVTRSNVIETRQIEGTAHMWRQLDPTTFLPSGAAEWRFEFGPIAAEYSISAVDGSATWTGLDVAGTRVEPAATRHALGDVVGSARLIASAGTFTAQEFTAWGERLAGPATLPNSGYCGTLGARQAFNGSQLTSSGLIAMGYRWYSPELGRFVMRDPIGSVGGLNVYAYAGNQPTCMVDPLGLDPHGGHYPSPIDYFPPSDPPRRPRLPPPEPSRPPPPPPAPPPPPPPPPIRQPLPPFLQSIRRTGRMEPLYPDYGSPVRYRHFPPRPGEPSSPCPVLPPSA